MAIDATKQKNNNKKQIKINKTAHITNTNNMNIYNNTNTNINTSHNDANSKLYGISLYNRLNIS